MDNNIDFINFPNNVKKFNSVVVHRIENKNGVLEFEQDVEKELKIKMKYLLAYQEALYHIGKHLSGPINNELIYLTSVLFEHFDPVKVRE